MKFEILGNVLVLVVIIRSRTTEACSCAPLNTESSICNSDFAGIVSVTAEKPTSPESMRRLFDIEVLEVWRNKTMNIPWEAETSSSSASCGVDLLPESEYLLTGEIPADGRLFLNLCGSLVVQTTALSTTERCDLKIVADNCSDHVKSCGTL